MYPCKETVETEDQVFSVYYLSEEDAPTLLHECEGDGKKRVVVHSRKRYGSKSWYGAYVVFPKTKSFDDVIADLYMFADGDATAEFAFDYLDEDNFKRLMSGGGQYTRYSSWSPTTYDGKGKGFSGKEDHMDEWIVVASHNRDSTILEREIYKGLAEATGNCLDMIEPDFGHWACGWIQILLVEPESHAFRQVKHFIDRQDEEQGSLYWLSEEQDLEGKMSALPHLRCVMHMHLDASRMVESARSWDKSPTFDMTEVHDAVSQITSECDVKEPKMSKYTDIFVEMLQEEGAEVLLD